jgi:hypothetical protein
MSCREPEKPTKFAKIPPTIRCQRLAIFVSAKIQFAGQCSPLFVRQIPIFFCAVLSAVCIMPLQDNTFRQSARPLPALEVMPDAFA